MAVALYRAYRPNDLHSVVGQRHITETLEKAFARGKVAHAYLLTGPRGVGKTSVARIIARRINDLDAEQNLDQELDIMEIDAASNRGIDEIRSLRDKIATSPTRLKYKVFIIDEVHMLTREAFNALLKTLEEPPAHVVFVLATTESHKLPDTIISRTQRHDFRSITTADLAQQLRAVTDAEKVEADDAALALIAERANGGFRDALSLLDMVASRGEAITPQLVAEMTGLGDTEQLLQILSEAVSGDYIPALQNLNLQLEAGAEPTIITEFLLSRVRQALLDASAKTTGTGVAQLKPDELIRVMQELLVAAREQRTASIPSVPLELALWRLGRPIDSSPPPATIAHTAPVAKPQPPKVAAPATKKPEGVVTNDTVVTTKALSLIKNKNNSLYAILRSGDPHIENDKLIISCRFRFHKERIEESKNQQFIEAVFTKVAGRTIELRVEIAEGQAPAHSQSQVETNSEELVASALEILGGEVMDS